VQKIFNWIKSNFYNILVTVALAVAIWGLLSFGFINSEIKSLNSKLVEQNSASLELIGQLNINIDSLESIHRSDGIELKSVRADNQKLERNNTELKGIITSFANGFKEAETIIGSAKHQ